MTKLMTLSDKQLEILELAMGSLIHDTTSPLKATYDEMNKLKNEITSVREDEKSKLSIPLASEDSETLYTFELELCDNHIWTSLVEEGKQPSESEGLFSLIEVRNNAPYTSIGLKMHENIIHVGSDCRSALYVTPELNDPTTYSWGTEPLTGSNYKSLKFEF